ncbi:MAG: PKD domain-containing protein, partial [Chitinophagaceae bacterium]
LDTGTYIFTLTVIDDSGATDSATVTIIVNPPKRMGTINNPIADAGNDTTIVMPINSVALDGSKTAEENTGGYIFYGWTKISGPQQGTIVSPGSPVTQAQGLVVGTYYFQLTVHINSGSATASDTIKVTVLPDPVQPGNLPYTANTYVPAYTNMFQYGTNTGYFPGWADTGIAGVALQAGAHSIRLPLPDYFVGHYGYDIRLSAFNYYTHQLGMKDITLFVGEPRPEYNDDSIYAPATQPSKVFANLYKPIWDNGENGTPVNDSNYFAVYIYNLVQRYGKDIKFWEIVNEPDATGFWDNGNPNRPDSWLNAPPSPASLLNLRAPIFYYIRMLRIAYEVIKKYYPDSYVCPGGIGYTAFLDALLRYTDNPDSGKVTPAYPLTGGAYMDAISFHCYPAYSLSAWDGSTGSFKWSRYSDRAADAIIDAKNSFDSVLYKYSYNGITHPKKLFIVTETNIPSKTFGTYFGSVDAQKNFVIKALVKSQENDIKQLYLYIIANVESDPNPGPYDYM